MRLETKLGSRLANGRSGGTAGPGYGSGPRPSRRRRKRSSVPRVAPREEADAVRDGLRFLPGEAGNQGVANVASESFAKGVLSGTSKRSHQRADSKGRRYSWFSFVRFRKLSMHASREGCRECANPCGKAIEIEEIDARSTELERAAELIK